MVVNSSIVARFKIEVNWKICASESATFHILNVMPHVERHPSNKKMTGIKLDIIEK